jgi:sulfur carrier protein
VITLHVNGQPHQLPNTLNITELLTMLDLAGKRIAVEKNGEIIPKSQHGHVAVADGDRLEIVVAVGGG